MSLDIEICSRPKVESICLTTFSNNSPLIAWVEKHITPIDNDVDVLISQENLQKLNDTLDQLNEANHQELFPVEDDLSFVVEDYTEDYWLHVAELKKWVKDTLNTFDFEKNELLLAAWW